MTQDEQDRLEDLRDAVKDAAAAYQAAIKAEIEAERAVYDDFPPRTSRAQREEGMRYRRHALYQAENDTERLRLDLDDAKEALELFLLDHPGVSMRMLQPHELAAAQGFPADYRWEGTKAERVAGIGNSVCPQVAAALVAANMEEA